MPGKWALVPSQALLGSDELFSTLFCRSKYKGFGKALELELLRCFFFIVSVKGRDCLAQTTGLSKPCGFCLVAVCLGRALLSCLTLQAPPSLSTAHNHLCVPCVDCPCPGEEGACSLLVLYNPLGCCKRRGGDYTAAIQLSMNPYYLLVPC